MSLDLAGILLAGLLTFASPCIVPLIPLYLGLLGGTSALEVGGGSRRRLVASATAFSLGLATVFVALGLVASAAGQALAAHRQLLLAVSGTVVIAFGLRFLGVLRLPFADREGRPWLHRLVPGGSLLGAYAFGAAFALGWTPCIGPVLGSVLTYTASTGASAARGALYLGIYAAGISVPLVGAAAFAPVALRLLDGLKPHLRKVEIASGLLLLGTGALLATDRLMLLMPSAGGDRPAVLVDALPAPGAAACAAGGDTGSACSVPESRWAAPIAAPVVPLGPAVVEIMSGSCPICRLMEPVVAEAERGCPIKVVRTFVEEPAGADLARRHAIRGVPTFLVLDASGGEVKRLVGQQPAEAVRGALELVSPRVCGATPAAGEARARGS